MDKILGRNFSKKHCKECNEDLQDNEIFDILGIEEENRDKEEYKKMLGQFRDLAKEHDKNDIWLKGDKDIAAKGDVVAETDDLIVCKECKNESLTEDEEAPKEDEKKDDDKGDEDKEESKEPKLETFDEQMDFLAKDEQEAIDGYDKVIALVDDEHVKEQLEHILDEEKAHKKFLEDVKKDKTLVYSHDEHEEEPKEDKIDDVEVIDDIDFDDDFGFGESLNERKSLKKLPTEVTIKDVDIDNIDDIEDFIMDYLDKNISSKVGFEGFEYDVEGKDILVYDIMWDMDYDESLEEDTIKKGNKWVNKGKEGTHGEFKTKKEADAQRKAMFANGYHEELEEDFDDDFGDVHCDGDDCDLGVKVNWDDMDDEDDDFKNDIYDISYAR